jgi:predicted RNA binding protein YcfA (HicA-like mRNA interferase family)
MTKLELERKFREAGWTLRHGKSHDHAVSPTGQVVPIPRHTGDLKKGTVRRILKEAGLS